MLNELKNKHPDAQPEQEDVLLRGDIPYVDPAQFNNIDSTEIIKATARTRGAAGPSGYDADAWRRTLISKNFSGASGDLTKAMAKMAQKMCIEEIFRAEEGSEVSSLEAYVACRLVPLGKDDNGVRPIGIGEVLRRIIGKAIVSVLKPDILKSAGSLQLCAGHTAGCEAAVHAMTDLFEEEENDALLLVDAENAFNSINRKVLLHNIQYLCPNMATYIRNCYWRPSRLFVTGGAELKSSEGTTQGDPLAMATYGIGILPLLTAAQKDGHQTKRVAFADDLAGTKKLQNLLVWWNNIVEIGPKLGFYPKASKSWLIVPQELYQEAVELFAGTGVKITWKGHEYLGGFIGSQEGKEEYSVKLVENWMDQLNVLSDIAMTEPQAAYSAFIKGFRHKLNYHLRVMKGMENQLQAFDDLIKNKFIPAITGGRVISNDERLLLSLPVRLGGMAIPIFSSNASSDYEDSRKLSKQLTDNVKQQVDGYIIDENKLSETRNQITIDREKRHSVVLEDLKLRMSPLQKRALELSQMKGASSWLSAMPLESEGFTLSKSEFVDAISIRYRWSLKRLPSQCPCGKGFSVDHAMSCAKGGFIIQRHDRIRDLFTNLANETHNDVASEPHLVPLTGEQLNNQANLQDEARLDISIRSFWEDGKRAFFDIMVFNPFAPTHLRNTIDKAFDSCEKIKKKHYNQRVIQIEHGTFTPLIFTPYGGAGREADNFIKRLALKIANKKGIHNSIITNWLRTKLSFELMRAGLLCVRGTRVPYYKPLVVDLNNVELVDYVE